MNSGFMVLNGFRMIPSERVLTARVELTSAIFGTSPSTLFIIVTLSAVLETEISSIAPIEAANASDTFC